ncbi:hypothetical protein BsIDN1_04720 [Bacillus safensis]|uniref:Uncharacterized protein n=1 Tax=Bacillus safensis TaxID=561879 RepID=A0A5S9M3Y2_BACIA|nr:hypothetical protein BsIDN1_04720 [Bacillus safensis]
MEKGLNKRWMGILFAILITISFGIVFNAVQSNTITVAFKNSFGLDRLTVGIVMAVIFFCSDHFQRNPSDRKGF